MNNTLTLSGTDNAALNISQGGALGSAAFASAQSFQPSGGALNLVAIDTSTTITCNMSGTKTFTVAPGLGFVSNMIVTAYVTSSPATYMVASVSSYSNTALVLLSRRILKGPTPGLDGPSRYRDRKGHRARQGREQLRWNHGIVGGRFTAHKLSLGVRSIIHGLRV